MAPDPLIERFELLSDMAADGVIAAKKSLPHLIEQINSQKISLGYVEPSFFISKPGYTKRMIVSLVAQAQIGSQVAEKEIVKFANWIIEQNQIDQKIASLRLVPLCNTGTLSPRGDFKAKRRGRF